MKKEIQRNKQLFLSNRKIVYVHSLISVIHT